MTLAETLKMLGRPVDCASKLAENLLGVPFEITGDTLSHQVRMWQSQKRLRIRDESADTWKASAKIPSRAVRRADGRLNAGQEAMIGTK